MDFNTAFDKLMQSEGGYVNDPADTGGETRYGVTIAVARAHGYTGPMRDLPVETAQAIARKLYWDAVRAEELPPALRYAVFDAAYHSGVAQSVKWLQRAVGASDDGRIGPQTLTYARSAHPDFALRRMLAQRLKFMTDLKVWPRFSRGWAKRVADLMES